MKILFLTGPHAVGKSYFMEDLAKTKDFFKFDTGPEMRKMHKESGTDKPIFEWVEELEKEFGPMVTCDMLCKVLESKKQKKDNIIVTGYRQIAGIEYTIDYFQPEDYEILYIDGNIDLLLSNYIKREGPIDKDTFKKKLVSEEEWGLRKVKEYVLNNPEHCQYVVKQSNYDTITTHIFDDNKQYIKNRDDNDG